MNDDDRGDTNMARNFNDIPLHPDDLLFFNEVVAAMRRVARAYSLPVRTITAYPMPEKDMANRLGDCNHEGHIRLVMRATVDGKFCDAPLSPSEVWNTAAHELAHLKHWNHGDDHTRYTAELESALREVPKIDDTQRILDKLVKLQNQSEGEKKIGNVEAAEAFAGMINKLLIDYELSESDIDYARNHDKDPIVEMSVDFTKYQIKFKRSRIAWQESLARIVAKAHLCTFLISPGRNTITFVGTRTHATLAEYAYGTLVPVVETWSQRELRTFAWECWAAGDQKKARGFRAAWLDAFLSRITERFDMIRKAAVQADVEKMGSQSQALIRLDGALVKVNKYIDDKFSSRKHRVNALSLTSTNHTEGRARGRAAADKITLGQRGVGTNDRKRIG